MSDVCTKIENLYQSGGVVNVCNGGHKIGPRICDKHDKLIYVQTGSNALDGGQANHAILKKHLRYEVVHWKQTYKPKNIFKYGLGR